MMGAEGIKELLKQSGRRGPQPGDPREAEDRSLAAEEAEVFQAPAGGRVLPQVGQQARVDDSGRDAGDPSGAPAAGASGRRPVRHIGSQRSLPPRDQPQQPVEEADGAACSRRDRAQREAHVAGGRGRAVRQRTPRARAARGQQPAVEVALGHIEGQAGPIPAEPAGQARRLLRPLGDRRGAGAETAPVRAAQEDGAGVVQAVHLSPAGAAGTLHHHQAGQGTGRTAGSGGVGHPRGSHPRPPDSAQPRSHLAPPRHPGLRARAGGGQGDQDSPPGLHRLQRRLRRRPDGRAHPALAGGPGGGLAA